MELKYNSEEDLFYQSKEVLLNKMINVLCQIFEKTLKSNKIFNVSLLIRQNFLTICETPEYMQDLFGVKYLFFEEIEDGEVYYTQLSRLESEVIEEVKNRLNLIDLDLNDVL